MVPLTLFIDITFNFSKRRRSKPTNCSGYLQTNFAKLSPGLLRFCAVVHNKGPSGFNRVYSVPLKASTVCECFRFTFSLKSLLNTGDYQRRSR